MIRSWCRPQYKRLCVLTLVAVYVLIAAGGLVRSLGAGMGCPDWPKCYGQWIPPTSAKNLPTDYRAQYYSTRKAKNFRIAATLERLGLQAAADRLRKEASVFRSEHFDTTKAWAEYLNRLVGAIVGLLVLATGLCSLSYVGTKPVIFWCSLAAGLGVVAAALMGAVVVATHLLPFTVTLHMGLTFFVIAALLVALRLCCSGAQMPYLVAPAGLPAWVWGLGSLFLVQVLLGTQLREEVDRQLLLETPREDVLEAIGGLFYVHRATSWGLLLGQVAVCCWLWRHRAAVKLQRLSQAIALTYIAEAGLGASLYYLGLPAAAQPLHLLLAFVAFGLQLLLLMECKMARPQAP